MVVSQERQIRTNTNVIYLFRKQWMLPIEREGGNLRAVYNKIIKADGEAMNILVELATEHLVMFPKCWILFAMTLNRGR